MKRMTIGDLKKILNEHNVPDDAIICCQSDSEGNETSTCLDVFIEKVGHKQYITPDFVFTSGEDIQGINLSADNDKTIVIFQPSL